MIGIGAMITEIGGNESSVNAVRGALNKKIKALSLSDDVLKIRCDDDYGIEITDEGQSCCEHRYLSTDDDLAYHVGATLLNFEMAQAEEITEEYGQVHEITFLRIVTSLGVATIASHNEHNGYYDGICLRARLSNTVRDEP